MTVVGTTPPPRLPVRDRAAAREHAGGGVSPMLTRLAAERATGVLEREHGALHLAEGRVVHAESPLAPGLDVLLAAHGTLDPTVWWEAVDRADEEYGVARLLLDSGRIGRGALEVCHLGAVYDAAYFALSPSSTPGRFRYGGGHWFGVLRPVTVDALERETLRRREMLHRLWPDPLPDTAPLLAAESGSGAAPGLTARQRAVLALVDGVRTASDIARTLGRQAFATLVDVRRLVAAGLLTARYPAPAPQTPPRVDLPRVDDPDITLLKRLRDALEAL
ncbi:transcriptional regulator [Streptomyces sp. NPDC006527]|uniref:transcriptional regulator n=1 Tax=Streptomyces sp. NPDC006527 TaxID=3364749 RepID=UPI003674CC76